MGKLPFKQPPFDEWLRSLGRPATFADFVQRWGNQNTLLRVYCYALRRLADASLMHNDETNYIRDEIIPRVSLDVSLAILHFKLDLLLSKGTSAW